MSVRKIVVATRKSELALAQCRQFLAQLAALAPGLSFEEHHVVTTGDKIQDRPLAEVGGKGLFLKEIEEELLLGHADIAVHSMKDVPPGMHPELQIACIPRREDARDVLLTKNRCSLADLPRGATLGSSSLRRSVQLSLARPDLKIVPLRGNVGTRIRKCREGEVDATILARAGLNRLGLAGEVDEDLSTELCLPAVGQGALLVQCRTGRPELLKILALARHEETEFLVSAERGVMAAVEGDCKTPVAAYGERLGNQLRLRALLARPDGSYLAKEELCCDFPATAEHAEQLGLGLGQALRARVPC